MRFSCPERGDGRLWRQQWHMHFAWWPVRIGPRQCVWWEWVERQQVCWDGDPFDPLRYYRYRLPQRGTSTVTAPHP